MLKDEGVGDVDIETNGISNCEDFPVINEDEEHLWVPTTSDLESIM